MGHFVGYVRSVDTAIVLSVVAVGKGRRMHRITKIKFTGPNRGFGEVLRCCIARKVLPIVSK